MASTGGTTHCPWGGSSKELGVLPDSAHGGLGALDPENAGASLELRDGSSRWETDRGASSTVHAVVMLSS